MKLAFSTLGCPGWKFEEVFAAAKDLKFDGIEIRGIANEMYAPNIKQFSDANLKNTVELLKNAGIAVPMLTSGAVLGTDYSSEKALDEAKDYIDLASKLGSSFVRVLITGEPQPTTADIAKAKQLYNQLCAYAKGKNVKVLIETNGPFANSDTLLDFMKDCDRTVAGVLWDIHHPYRFCGEKPEYTFNNLKGWIDYVHVKDSVMENGILKYRIMGYGNVPVFDALKLLHNSGYNGFVSLEWVKRWCPDLQEAGIVFAQYINYMSFMFSQLNTKH